MQAASAANLQQMQQQSSQAAVGSGQAPLSWTCGCGQVNSGKFCTECGSPRAQAASWTCSCGQVNSGKFCSECGKPRP